MYYDYGFNVEKEIRAFIKRGDAHAYTYIVMGRPGPTGKTRTCNWLKQQGFNAVEISEGICGAVSYDDRNHFIVNTAESTVCIILNETVKPTSGIMFGFVSRREASDFIRCLNDIIKLYGCATLADAYDLIGESTHYTDNNLGWFGARNVKVSSECDGTYRVILPKPTPII